MYKEFFYWMYIYIKKVNDKNIPTYNAFIFTCVWQYFNFLTIFSIIDFYWNLAGNIDPILGGLVLFVIFGIINFIFILSKKEEIIKKYDNLPKLRRVKGQILFIFYFLLSIIFVVLSVKYFPASAQLG